MRGTTEETRMGEIHPEAKPRWARLIIAEGAVPVTNAKTQSVFKENRTMGGITCLVVPEDLLDGFIMEIRDSWTEPEEDSEGEHLIGTEEGKR